MSIITIRWIESFKLENLGIRG